MAARDLDSLLYDDVNPAAYEAGRAASRAVPLDVLRRDMDDETADAVLAEAEKYEWPNNREVARSFAKALADVLAAREAKPDVGLSALADYIERDAADPNPDLLRSNAPWYVAELRRGGGPG